MSKPETGHAPLPWHQGGTNGQELRNPSVIFAADGAAVAQFYGIPLNCKLDEVDRRRYAEGLANVAAALEALNSHAALMESALALKRLRERHAKWKRFMEWSASDTLLMAESGAALAGLEKQGVKL